ncbi:MAG: inositol-3-phosphate synthase [Actinobacteria bacterium 13_1_20CM_2_65_11]|nr:MAG: inositol-3-phosphate synthase [Chloroflexi bacterium 13_1_40CM_3_65_12]OLD48458.1 MAG: inositol-3-phosphate synthase [Actinobacteria bacterium 13_1_40CM_2_65_8]OLE79720.1 MAG: inositol-3-phosphate synthase [Actinobacteria bacterium 13_1_20CM_2_65_11]
MKNGQGDGHRNGQHNGKVRVAIVGVGNCASSFVQGVHYYRDASPKAFVPGLMHVNLGGYHVSDIEFVAAFDVDRKKVGLDLSDAIFAGANNTVKFTDVPRTGVKVQRGMTHDGIGKYVSDIIVKAPGETSDVVGILKKTKADVLVSYLPVGSEEATKWYVEQALQAGVGFVNCIPVFIAREPYWQKRFTEKNLPIIGDDIKSQVGATIIHRVLTRLFRDRGVKLERTYQLNFGGNTDFLNMLERDRLMSKKLSKTRSVTSQLDYDIGADNVHIGPSDYVPWLNDRKWAYIRLEGRTFGDVPLNVELKLEVHDSPNSAGIVIDAVRCIKLALDRGIGGALEGPSSYFMKSPPVQYSDSEAKSLLEEFIDAGKSASNGRVRRIARTKPATAAARR